MKAGPSVNGRCILLRGSCLPSIIVSTSALILNRSREAILHYITYETQRTMAKGGQEFEVLKQFGYTLSATLPQFAPMWGLDWQVPPPPGQLSHPRPLPPPPCDDLCVGGGATWQVFQWSDCCLGRCWLDQNCRLWFPFDSATFEAGETHPSSTFQF